MYLRACAVLPSASSKDAGVPAGTVCVSVTSIVAASPGVPCAPWGMPRLRTKLGVWPVMLAVTGLPGGRVSTCPIVMVGVCPAGPCGPCPPVAPAGMPSVMTGASAVPVTSTVGSAPSGSCVTRTWICGVAPVAPRGTTKSSTAALSVPELVTWAWVPGSPVVVRPTVTVAASPGGPGGPTSTSGSGMSDSA